MNHTMPNEPQFPKRCMWCDRFSIGDISQYRYCSLHEQTARYEAQASPFPPVKQYEEVSSETAYGRTIPIDRIIRVF